MIRTIVSLAVQYICLTMDMGLRVHVRTLSKNRAQNLSQMYFDVDSVIYIRLF